MRRKKIYKGHLYICPQKSLLQLMQITHEALVKIKYTNYLFMYSKVKYSSASCHVYRVLLLSFFHLQKSKDIDIRMK